jgi:hypothetical protein
VNTGNKIMESEPVVQTSGKHYRERIQRRHPLEPNEKGHEREPENFGPQHFYKGAAGKYISCRNKANTQTNAN